LFHQKFYLTFYSTLRKQSASKHFEEPAIDLHQALYECQQINQLFFQNHLNAALEKTKAQYKKSHTLLNIIFYLLE
jgi:hypothetical protein